VRTNLRNLEGQKHRFLGRINHFGSSFDNRLTILLMDVFWKNERDVWEYVTDHVWLTMNKEMDVFGPKGRDIIEFDSCVRAYVSEGQVNYGLKQVSNLSIFPVVQDYNTMIYRATKRKPTQRELVHA
jgi:hypothetical protein